MKNQFTVHADTHLQVESGSGKLTLPHEYLFKYIQEMKDLLY